MNEQHQNAIQALSEHSRTSADLVKSLYWKELRRLAPSARITQYLPLVIGRRVRDILRLRSQSP